MRVLVLTDSYPPAATGGYERSCENVVTRWRAAGDAVTVLTTAADVESQPGVLRQLTRTDAGAIDAALREFRPDVVSAWNLARVPQTRLLAPIARAGIPLCIVACDGWLADAEPDLPPAAPGSLVAFVSADLRSRVALPPWAPQHTIVVPSGIDDTLFRRHPRPPWRGRLLYVGRLAGGKGVTDAIDALADLPEDVTLQIVAADRPERWSALRDYLARTPVADRVSAASAQRHELPAMYADADVLLFPSRWREPFGLVPLEAMACGTPVIATGVGGSASYLVDGGNALVTPPGDPGGLAAAVEKLAGDDRLRAVLVEGGFRTSRHYTVDRTAVLLAEAHRRAIASE